MYSNVNLDNLIDKERCEKIQQQIIEKYKDKESYVTSKYKKELKKLYNEGLDALENDFFYDLELYNYHVKYVKSDKLLMLLSTLFKKSGFKVIQTFESLHDKTCLVKLNVSVLW